MPEVTAGAGLEAEATDAENTVPPIVAMDLATLHDAGTHPSAVPLGPLPAEDIDLQLAHELRGMGRVVFQEQNAVLDCLLPPA